MLRLNMGLRACPLGKHSRTMRKNFFPRLVFTLMSKGGLYHVMFLFLILRGFFLLFFGSNFNLYVYPLLSSAAWYVGAALLNTSSSDEILDRPIFNQQGFTPLRAVSVIRKNTEFLSSVLKFFVPVQIYVADTWVDTSYVDRDVRYPEVLLPFM